MEFDGSKSTLVNAGTIIGTGGIAVVLGSGNQLIVEPGATFVGSIEDSGESKIYVYGSLTISPGQTISNASVLTGGVVTVVGGGEAVGTINSGGALRVLSGGVATATTIVGGVEYVELRRHSRRHDNQRRRRVRVGKRRG